MVVLLLPGVLLIFFLVAMSWQRCLREGMLLALLGFGLTVLCVTEALGLFGWVRPMALSVAWVLAALVVAAVERPAVSFNLSSIPRIWQRPFETALWLCCCLLLGLVAVTALASAPNSFDAMAYHLPRVIYFAQQGSPDFYPTSYLNQLMMPPLAEYFMLHTYVLGGGDQFANCVQWLGMFGSVLGISLLAREMGAGIRGQAIAALFSCTLPNGLLQGSGAKNDWLLTCWLLAAAYFALRSTREPTARNKLAFAVSVGLAVITKSLAYLIVPCILAGIYLGSGVRERRRLLRAVPLAVGAVLLINGGHYARNLDLSGSPLGFDSAFGRGEFRWRMDRFGFRETASAALRHISDQVGSADPTWNQRAYDVVLRAHNWLDLDPNDPATTFRWGRFKAPREERHEATANNRKHLILLLLSLTVAAIWSSVASRRLLLWYSLGLVAAFVLFCAYLKWAPYNARLLLPLFVLAAPLAAAVLGRARWWASMCVCLILLDHARLYATENWTRSLKGEHSVLRTSREEEYFADVAGLLDQGAVTAAARGVADSGCRQVGIDADHLQLEYPFQALLLARNPAVHFTHVGVENASEKYRPADEAVPCAVLCLGCEGDADRINRYRHIGSPQEIERMLLFVRLEESNGSHQSPR